MDMDMDGVVTGGVAGGGGSPAQKKIQSPTINTSSIPVITI